LPSGERADRPGRGNGVPTGLQIVADAYEDLDAFQIAAAYAGIAPRFFSANLVPDYRDQP
jgi:Asp-tRNA(Asn)/Glu-tRNA(Gln) amidotransferase A subunit family amidase